MIAKYEKIIKTALEIQQKRLEITMLLGEFSKNITLSEFKDGDFDCETAKKAFKLIEGLSFERANYVQFQALYKDLRISLHCDPDIESNKVMTMLIHEIRKNGFDK